MEIIGIVVYVISSLFGAFAFEQLVTEQQRKLIPHGIIFIGIALLSVYFLNNDYFFESLISTTLFGIPLIFSKGSTPEFLYRKINRFNIALSMMIFVFLTIMIFM